LKDIERLIKRPIPHEVVPGFEPDPNEKPEPIQRRSQGRGQAPGQGQGRQNPRGGEGRPNGEARREGGRPNGDARGARPAKPSNGGAQPSRDARNHSKPNVNADSAPRRQEPAKAGQVANSRKPGGNPGALLNGRRDAVRSGDRGR
jgi:ATP-dependent RNA helicase RhlE